MLPVNVPTEYNAPFRTKIVKTKSWTLKNEICKYKIKRKPKARNKVLGCWDFQACFGIEHTDLSSCLIHRKD